MRRAAQVLLAMVARLLRSCAEFLRRLSQNNQVLLQQPQQLQQPLPPPESWLEHAKPPPPPHWLERVRAATPEFERPVSRPAPKPAVRPVPERRVSLDAPETLERSTPAPVRTPRRPPAVPPPRSRPPALRARFGAARHPKTEGLPEYQPRRTTEIDTADTSEGNSEAVSTEAAAKFGPSEAQRRSPKFVFPLTAEPEDILPTWPKVEEEHPSVEPRFPEAPPVGAEPPRRFEAGREESSPDTALVFAPTPDRDDVGKGTSFPDPARRVSSRPAPLAEGAADPWPVLPDPADTDAEDRWNERAREADRLRRLDSEQRGLPWNA